MLGVVVAISVLGSRLNAQISNQPATAQKHEPGPAESLYLQLGSVGLDESRVFRVRDASIDRAAIHITLDDGVIAFTKDVLGKITGAFFLGDGEILLTPPSDVERRSMGLFTGMAILEERFSSAYFRFNDDTAAELQPGLRAPDPANDFVSRWDQTARNLAHEDAMRLLSTFCELLPASGEASKNATTRTQTDPEDRLLHARLQGNTLGIFDVFFDSTADEQIEAGQSRAAGNGNIYYDVWTSFSTNAEPKKVLQKKIPETLPEQSESRQNRILVRSYVIDAHVNPPKEIDADVMVQLDTEHGGSRFLIFELSRFLQVETVEADGQPVEFIHNPAVEGSRLARSGDDLVAVILSKPAVKGEKLSLRFRYKGEVLAEAGKGLLYVGERGTWYPNRGLAMADFDLTFHYPRGWTLLATGKPAPVAVAKPEPTQPATQNSGEEQVGHWISERPIPLAGFNLGQYIRAEAKAGDVTVEAYATPTVERDFPTTPPPLPQPAPLNPFQRYPRALPPSAPPLPSPASNELAVAKFTADAIRYYADRFGRFPYSQLALTQLPGRESQGWPGLIFLSSYAFLSPREREDIHMNAAGVLIDQLVPAHEAAHQWWGDLVTWSTYHDQWFSEGLANYSALMMLQEKNPAGFRLIMEKYRDELAEKNENAGPVTLGSRLLSSRFPQGYQAISYGRATWLFHMLRSFLQDGAQKTKGGTSSGPDLDEPFVRCLHKLREQYAGKSITTREMLDVFAEDLPPDLRYEGKSSLDWFLDGWINGTSLPKLELQGVKFASRERNTIVTGVIRQTNAPDSLVTSVPIYAAVAGKTPVLLRRVFADGAETSFRLSAPAGTRKLLLDPYATVLSAPKHEE
jgi:Peptidase family M1 domain